MNGAYIFDADSGSYVSQEHQQIAEMINDYDQSLSLVWIPPQARELNEEYPFAVLHTPDDGRQPYIVFKIKADELDARVIARLWRGDQKKHDVLGELEAYETAKKLSALKAQMDEDEEKAAFGAWAIRSPKTVRHNGVTYG